MCQSLHVDRRVGSFTRWYKIRCASLEHAIMWSFIIGVVCMFLTVSSYVMAHLENGDSEETHSTRAWIKFVWTLVVLVGMSFTLPEVLGGEFTYRIYHDGPCAWGASKLRDSSTEERVEVSGVLLLEVRHDAWPPGRPLARPSTRPATHRPAGSGPSAHLLARSPATPPPASRIHLPHPYPPLCLYFVRIMCRG